MLIMFLPNIHSKCAFKLNLTYEIYKSFLISVICTFYKTDETSSPLLLISLLQFFGKVHFIRLLIMYLGNC